MNIPVQKDPAALTATQQLAKVGNIVKEKVTPGLPIDTRAAGKDAVAATATTPTGQQEVNLGQTGLTVNINTQIREKYRGGIGKFLG